MADFLGSFSHDASRVSRRRFVQSAAMGTAAAIAAPTVLTASKTTAPIVLGQGEHRYEVLHDWPELPKKFTWQTTHNVALDRDGFLYVIHEGDPAKTDHPSIFVFDPEGKYVRSFGQMFQGGGHGLEVREEDGEQFVYVTAYRALKTFAKLTLDGEVIWQRFAPMEAGIYAAGEDTHRTNTTGRDRFHPTNFAFPPDGGFLLADGYGTFTIHRYDDDANWQSHFGGPGEEDGRFNTPHGIWIDNRPGREPSIVVADRANARLQWLSLDGVHQQTLDGFLYPANMDTRGDVMLVPDLHARITLLAKDNQVIAQLGDDPAWRSQVLDGFTMRGQPERWQAGKFLHPHDACFDAEGNIFVAEWVATGRITKLRHVA